MAIVTKAVKVETATQYNAVQETGKKDGVEYLGVGPVDGNPFGRLSAKASKWAWLFKSDASGDPMLLNVLSFLLNETPDEEHEAIHTEIEKFIATYQKMMTEA